MLLFLLLLIPLFFAASSIVFQEVLPRDVPVAVVPEDDNVTDRELTYVETAILRWSEPEIVEDRETADAMLTRESVYAVIVVPSGFLDDGGGRAGDVDGAEAANEEATFRLVIDGAITPYHSPSELIQDLVEFELQAAEDLSEVSVEREIEGEEKSFAEYLYPSMLVGFLIFLAFTYVPYTLRREAPVLDRVRIESSLEAVLAVKLLTFGILVTLPLVVFHAVAVYFDYGVATTSPWAIAVVAMTFLMLSALAMAIMVASRFSGTGQFVNLVVMLGLLAFSGLVFPLGFFSPIRTTIAQLLPTHYAIVTVRSLMLKDDATVWLFQDMIVGLSVAFLVALLLLWASARYYRRVGQ